MVLRHKEIERVFLDPQYLSKNFLFEIAENPNSNGNSLNQNFLWNKIIFPQHYSDGFYEFTIIDS